MLGGRDEVVILEQRRGDVELDVGRGHPRPRVREEARLGDVGREPAAALDQVPQHVQRALGVEQRARTRAQPVPEPDDKVVLEIPPDARPVGCDADAVLAQVRGVADAREHQQLRRVDGPARE